MPHLPALQVVVPLLAAPLVILLRPRGLAWAAAIGQHYGVRHLPRCYTAGCWSDGPAKPR
ncbi:MAG: hypothetical protein U5Q16_09680 [Gammaproteobacteria bacterium]|nr:hypothetical protein [Gammaproteobacteria bacterium]